MNKQEIDKVMEDLPSQQTETTFQKIYISVLFILLFTFICYVPDF
jgi:hypothetical protein